MTDSNSSTPPPVAPPPTGTNSTSSSSAGTGNEETGSSGTGNSVSRPVRTAAAMANAISEAQSDMKKRKDLGPGGRKKRKDREKIASRISGLDLLHDTTMNCIEGITYFKHLILYQYVPRFELLKYLGRVETANAQYMKRFVF